MDTLLQEILDATVSPGISKEVPWGQLRPLCDGANDIERMHAFMLWCARNGRVATAPDLAGPTGLPDAAVISIGRG
ncbi:hypothetical protein ABWH74_002259 [Burkholderia vietnamiensis]|jgi:hypothetical protein|uniref:hypothetical protein n=1 Tax=Burkholderia vietnamiensis TaxID=60552 RepID=UPI000ACC69D5|nr:hypothetical protein [Burkholderia vietnamiensis]MBR8283775.1 hypothetical protein [Burkholderia vietnamiensis]MDN7411427.1 hypothetical protein [Burkholderia vietnamiensis]MDN8115707.1 hypothetical protein [Burkholderia vietnamiensis]MEC4599267.1 hypothetical protein [Burkholderia vietnamiensis]QTK84033.1 hypothetical protein J4D21_11800 [Burkholderia vietnamiensis]